MRKKQAVLHLLPLSWALGTVDFELCHSPVCLTPALWGALDFLSFPSWIKLQPFLNSQPAHSRYEFARNFSSLAPVSTWPYITGEDCFTLRNESSHAIVKSFCSVGLHWCQRQGELRVPFEQQTRKSASLSNSVSLISVILGYSRCSYHPSLHQFTLLNSWHFFILFIIYFIILSPTSLGALFSYLTEQI